MQTKHSIIKKYKFFKIKNELFHFKYLIQTHRFWENYKSQIKLFKHKYLEEIVGVAKTRKNGRTKWNILVKVLVSSQLRILVVTIIKKVEVKENLSKGGVKTNENRKKIGKKM